MTKWGIVKTAFAWILASTSIFLFAEAFYGQDDESRQQNGLPTYIGSRPGSSQVYGADATVSGSFIVQGLDPNAAQPTFSVAVLANGAIVSRQRVKNGGGFTFINVPRTSVSLIAEVDGLEMANYQIGNLNPPPLSNRHDVILSWAQVGSSVKLRNEVVSARNSYKRSDAGQKRFEEAISLAKQQKPEAAEKEFKKLLSDDPRDFLAWTELGSLYFVAEKYGEAEVSYNKALALKSDFIPALLNLGKLDIQQKRYDAAIDVLTKSLVLSPDSADINHYLGEAYLQIKKGSKAVPLLNRAIELAPVEKAELHLRLATLYIGANLKDRAAAEYKLFLIQVPNYKNKTDLEKFIKDNPPK